MNKKNRLKKITVPSDCWEKSHLFLRKFSLQKDYSSKWVGEKFPSFFEKISKIRSHSVKKSFFCHSKSWISWKFRLFFPIVKMDLVHFLTKMLFTNGHIFQPKKEYNSKWGGELFDNARKSMASTLNPFLRFQKMHFFRLQLRICYEKWIFKIPHTTHFRFFKSLGL